MPKRPLPKKTIARLQERLVREGYPVAEGELAGSLLGKTTRAGVKDLAARLGAAPPTTIDATTIKSLLERAPHLGDPVFEPDDVLTRLGNVDRKLDVLKKLESVDQDVERVLKKHKLDTLDKTLGTQDTKLEALKTGVGGVKDLVTDVQRDVGTVKTALDAQAAPLGGIEKNTAKLASIDEKIGALKPAAAIGLNAQGDDVAAIQAKLAKLGYAIPKRELDAKQLGAGTRDAIRAVQERYALRPSGVLDDGTRAAIDQAVALSEGPNKVQGRVVLENSLPARGLVVSLWERRFGGGVVQVQNATCTTDPQGDGHYEIAYAPSRSAVGFELRARDATGQDVAISYPKLAAAKNEVVDLVVATGIQRLDSEYKRLVADLTPHLDDLKKLGDAKEGEDRQDLSELHEQTGWDARIIAMAARAMKLSNQAAVAVEAVYGALRAGLPTDLQQLALVGSAAFEAALRRSIQAGIVSPTAAELATAIQQYAAFSSRLRGELQIPGTNSTLAQFVARAGLTQAERVVFEEIFFAHRGTPGELWAKLDARLPGKLGALQLVGKLAFLTLNNAPLVAGIQAKVLTQGAALGKLADDGYFKADAWQKLIRDLAAGSAATLESLVPPGVSGDSIDERLATYAEDLARKVRTTFPTRVIAAMVGKELSLGADVDASVKQVLLKADGIEKDGERAFVLGRTPLDAFLKTYDAALFGGVQPAVKQKVVAKLTLLQRLYQITPSDEALVALLASGFTSAQDVTAFKLDVFLGRFGGKFRTRDEAIVLYRKAQQVTAVAYNFFAAAKQLTTAPPIHVVSPPAEQRDTARKKLGEQYPSMESLFGSLDYCECEHCQSVLGPAAYFVDMLQFIDPDKLVWESFLQEWKERHAGQAYTARYKKAYDVLVSRRPDLPHLALTCENTHTALPYIDVVNEILEYSVARGKLDEGAAYDSGSAASADLLAEPQNVRADAYEKLKKAPYPMQLPFDLATETVRELLSWSDTSLAEAREAFRARDGFTDPAKPAEYGRDAVFFEQLGVTPAELEILTGSSAAEKWHEGWHRLYGYAANDVSTAQTELASAKTLARRLGVTYREVVDLVSTSFVNPKLDALALVRKLGVGADDVLRYRGDAGGNALPAADREGLEQRIDALSTAYGGLDVKAWLTAAGLKPELARALVLHDPTGASTFDATTLRFADGTPADDLTLLKLNLFVRIWRKLGWTIDEVDRALQAFLPRGPLVIGILGPALRTALLYLSHLKDLCERLGAGEGERVKLLALWTRIPTTGRDPLYAKLFLGPPTPERDPVFDDPHGSYLSKAGVAVGDHLPAIQGALGLTASDVGLVLGAGSQAADLTLDVASRLYRHALLAKALRLDVAELVALKTLSGVDPFAPLEQGEVTGPDEDAPFASTLRFVELAECVRDSGLRVDDVAYLLRHRYDPAGPHRPDPGALFALVRSLAEALARVEADNATPTAPEQLTDDLLREKLSLVVSRDDADRFLGMWVGTAEFEATEKVAPAQALDPAPYAAEPALRCAYDTVREVQRLAYRGVLLDAERQRLGELAPAGEKARVAALLGAIQAKARDFYDGALAALLGVPFEQIFAVHAPGHSEAQREAERARRRADIVATVLKGVRRALARRAVVETVASGIDAPAPIVHALLSEPRLLSLGGEQPLDVAFASAAERGATARFVGAGGVALPDAKLPGVDTRARPPAAQGASAVRFECWLEVPAAGPYRFHVRGKKDARVELRVGDVAEPIVRTTLPEGGASGLVELLEPGRAHRVVLDAANLAGGDVDVTVESDGLARCDLERLTIRPGAAVATVERARVLLGKAVLLVQRLALGEREVRWMQGSNSGWLDLRALPASDADGSDGAATKLFQPLLRVLGYRRLRDELGADADDLVAVFDAARRPIAPDANVEAAKQALLEAAAGALARLTRRDPTVVLAVAARLGFGAAEKDRVVEAPAFADERGLSRLWEALRIVERLGAPPDAIARWVAPGPNFAVTREARNVIKARQDPQAWRRVAQPIFDRLRQRKRDALVAYLGHALGRTREELFEHFLVDPGMEPVVQTSRLRLALSSVQLFIQRCLLNLEKEVHPSAVDGKQWDWMKRYRVWEANRKIFLFPENWLEPEFRDDKTHLFQELEGTLLQGDVSNDLAEDAFHRYVRGLEEIARLEVVATYADEDPVDPASNVLHVVGRSYGLPHRYYYQAYAHGAWTPWEKVEAEIEGDHLGVIAWRDRLHLFWVTFLEKPLQDANSDQKVKDVAEQTVAAATPKQIEVQLSWSERYQGEWTARGSSGFGAPVPPQSAGTFDPRQVFIHLTKEYDADGEERAVQIHLTGALYRGLEVVSKNGDPEPISAESPPRPPFGGSPRATRWERTGALEATFVERIVTVDGGPATNVVATKPILNAPPRHSVVMPGNRVDVAVPGLGPLVSPFFFQDVQHTFFVEPTVVETTVEKWEEWAIFTPPPAPWADDPRWFDRIPIEPAAPERKKLPPAIPADGVDLSKKSGPKIKDWLTHEDTLVDYGGRSVGKQGRADNGRGDRARGRGQVERAPMPASRAAIPGAGPRGPAFAAVPPNVIGGAGLTRAALQNILEPVGAP